MEAWRPIRNWVCAQGLQAKIEEAGAMTRSALLLPADGENDREDPGAGYGRQQASNGAAAAAESTTYLLC